MIISTASMRQSAIKRGKNREEETPAESQFHKLRALKLPIVLIVGMFFLHSSCDINSSGYDYKSLKKERSGELFPAEFILETTDTVSLYNIYFSSRVNIQQLYSNHIDLSLTLISPSSDTSISVLSLPIITDSLVTYVDDVKVISSKKKGWIYDIEWLYLHGIPVSEIGKWHLIIDIKDNKESSQKAILGMGVKYERQR